MNSINRFAVLGATGAALALCLLAAAPSSAMPQISDPNCVCIATSGVALGGNADPEVLPGFGCSYEMVIQNYNTTSGICSPPPFCEELPTTLCGFFAKSIMWVNGPSWDVSADHNLQLLSPCGGTASSVYRCPTDPSIAVGVQVECAIGCTPESDPSN